MPEFICEIPECERVGAGRANAYRHVDDTPLWDEGEKYSYRTKRSGRAWSSSYVALLMQQGRTKLRVSNP